MRAHGPARGGEEAVRAPRVTGSGAGSLPVSLPEGFRADLVCAEARATLTLRRRDGADEPPLLDEESGCRLEGTSGTGPYFCVIDAPASSVLDRLVRLTGEETLPLPGGAAARLAAEAHAWAGPLRAAMSAQEAVLPPGATGVLGIRWEARVSLGAVRIARRAAIPLPAVPPDGPDPASDQPRSHVEVRAAAGLRRGDRVARGEAARWLAAGAPDPAALGPLEGLLEEALRRAADRFEEVSLQAMEAPAVFSPAAAGVLIHEICGHLLEGDLIASRLSPFAGRAGERLAPEAVTILDDPLVGGGRIRMAVDDEGEGTGVKVLLDRGRLAGFITDRRTAASLGGLSSGNGRRESYRHGALPRMTNLVMTAGDADPADLGRGIRRGLWVERLGRGQVDPRLGRFRLEVESGRIIEGGRLTHSVAGGWLAGSCLDLLAGIEAVGADPEMDRGAGLCIKEDQILPVGQIFPSLRVGRLRVHPGAAP